jgi:hypothetical protein
VEGLDDLQGTVRRHEQAVYSSTTRLIYHRRCAFSFHKHRPPRDLSG